jgi:hypothetical protein
VTGILRRRRDRVTLAAAAVLYAGLAVAAQLPLVRGLGDRVYGQELPGNDCLLHAWTLAWGQHALATDPAGVFDANVFFPHARTLLYSDHLLGLAVLLVPLRLLTDNAVALHNAATVLAPAANALAAFALARDLTGHAAAALVGGYLYGFAPFRFDVDRCQIQVLAAWWLPLVLLFGRRAVAENRVGAGLLAGVALAFQGLTGIYLTAFLLPVLPLAHLWWLGRHGARGRGRGWAGLLAGEGAALVGLGLVSRAYRAVQEELGISRSLVTNALLSLHPAELGTALTPVTLGTLVLAALLLRGRAPATFRAERGLHVAIALGTGLLAFGPLVPLPAGLGYVKGPYAAMARLPGYDALRAPGRALRVAALGAAVLAAGGFAALVGPLPPVVALGAAALALGGAALEHWPGEYQLVAAPRPAARSPAYAWLAAAPPGLAFVELPVDRFQKSASNYQHASTAHWRRMVNGNSGLLPPLYPHLLRELERFPAPDVLGLLRGLGVTHAVVHAGIYLPRPVREQLAAMRGDPNAPLRLRYEGGDTLVYAIEGPTPPGPLSWRGRPLDRHAWRVSASHAAGLAAAAVDADPETYWSNLGDLEAGLREGWHHAVSFDERWAGFVATQPSRFTVDLGAPASVTAVEVRLGGSDPLLAPLLRVEISPDGADWSPLPGVLAPVPDAQALVTRPREARFAAVPAGSHPTRFVRLSGPGVEWRLRDLQVHAD